MNTISYFGPEEDDEDDRDWEEIWYDAADDIGMFDNEEE